jgi:hypothetical protein
LLHTLASGNRLELTECRRSDAVLFDFYPSILSGGSRVDLSLGSAVQAAKELLTYDAPAEHNLVISHQKRIRVNREINQRLAPADAVRLEVTGRSARGNAAQTMLIWPGIVLVGCVAASRKGIQNGVLYKVETITDEKTGLEGDVVLTHDQTKKWLRLSFALTYASCQGSEFDGPLR